MTFRYIVAGLSLMIGGSISLAQTDFRWKFKQGEHFFVKQEEVVKQTMEYDLARIGSDTSLTTVSSFTITKAGKDGTTLEQKIESVEIKNSTDSKSADALADALKDSVFTITLDGSGKITKYEGYEALLAKLGKLNESTARIVRATVPRESLQDPLAELFSFAPEKAVKPGESWQREMQMSMAPLGGFKLQNKYTDAGKGSAEADRKLSMIDIVCTATYMPPRHGDEPFPFKILEGKLKVESAKGAIAFDPENGRVERLKLSMKTAGDLTIEIGGQKSQCTIERQQTLRMQVLDKAPEKP